REAIVTVQLHGPYVEAGRVADVECLPGKFDGLRFSYVPALAQGRVNIERTRTGQFIPLTRFTRKRFAEVADCGVRIAENIRSSSGENKTSSLRFRPRKRSEERR